MSHMKRFAEESEWFKDRAALAAWTTDRNKRSAEFEQILRDCEKAAQVYAHPYEVGRQFKAMSTSTFWACWQVVMTNPLPMPESA